MSAFSGIGISEELSEAFASALESNNTRFIKVVIKNEVLVPDGTISISGSFGEDLDGLQANLDESSPVYVLARLDDLSSGWLAISYVPDNAQVRDKMLYASTRNTLTKSLGSTHFTDSLYANSKSDLTSSAYAAHKAHLAAPKPLSAREQEMADVRAAEREAGGSSYEGARARRNHIGTGVGLAWGPEVETALQELAQSDQDKLIVITIDPTSETLICSNSRECTASELNSFLPPSDPAYAFFSWAHSAESPREVVFIYSCPSSSPVKFRMIYSSSATSVYQTAKSLSLPLANRKIETSDPKEINESFLRTELGLASGELANSPARMDEEKKPFARPKGPGRKR